MHLAKAADSQGGGGPEARYKQARISCQQHSSDPAAAVEFAHACADWADIIPDHDKRAAVAREGIEAARSVIATAPQNGAAHFYLALNIGELAQTKKLGALSLVKEMERELLEAISLDATIDHGGPDRSLGMLYRDTPGRPISIGSKSKALQHLEKAVKIAPDYPDNLLTLMESYLKWDDHESLSRLISDYEKILPEAKKKYSGPEYEQPWRDWEERWRKIRNEVR